jgi:hypothetical protein
VEVPTDLVKRVPKDWKVVSEAHLFVPLHAQQQPCFAPLYILPLVVACLERR